MTKIYEWVLRHDRLFMLMIMYSILGMCVDLQNTSRDFSNLPSSTGISTNDEVKVNAMSKAISEAVTNNLDNLTSQRVCMLCEPNPLRSPCTYVLPPILQYNHIQLVYSLPRISSLELLYI